MSELLRIEEPNRPPTDSSGTFPLWRMGFRPFFLFGAGFGLLALALWVAFYTGLLPTSSWTPLGGWLGWHRHEMPFGFVTAIIAGFLLTSVQNWTSRPSLSGMPLMALFALWAAARIAWLAGLPWQLALVPETAFFLMLAFSTGRLLWQARQSHNYSVPATLVLMAAADAQSIAGIATLNDAWQHDATMSMIWLITALSTMIGGRVIPFFTQRGLYRQRPRATPLKLDVALMSAAFALALLAALGWGTTPSLPFAVFFALLAGAHLWRVWRWHDAGIWRVPLLWSLHVACLWLAVAFAAFALYHVGILQTCSLALHALTIGALTGLILAMIARVSLGHTGRPLRAPRAMGWAFVLLNLGAAARAFVMPWHFLPGIVTAALCWLAAFGLFTYLYAPILLAPRADGRPG